ncbi:hypothetical protein [Aurantiacibacter suaedae]|uniref:hypothetical protein n=1 Tax=Aurantiacibacter suaedae TaxID=2545755 RepID=UPI0010F56040|nr:hypothetical protein [Aurantiacibacter suaedae]
MLNRLALAFAALLLLPAAASAETLDGSWALRINDTTIFRFDLQQTGEGEWSGVWARPRSYRNNGVIFSNLEGQAEVTSRSASIQGDALRLTFNDPRPRSLPEVLRFRITGERRAELTYVDTGFAPLPLVRVAPTTEVGPFDKSRLYDRDNAQTMPTRLAVPERGVAAPAPASTAQSPQELPALATPAAAARSQPVQELPASATPAPRIPQAVQEQLPPVATSERPGPRQQLPTPAMPTRRVAAQPASVAPTPASSEPGSGGWQPDPSVSAAIAARAAALDRSAAPAVAEPRTESERPAAAPATPPPAPSAPQTGAWQPDPTVRAAIAERAAALNGSAEPSEGPDTESAKPDSRLGADFLEGF